MIIKLKEVEDHIKKKKLIQVRILDMHNRCVEMYDMILIDRIEKTKWKCSKKLKNSCYELYH